MPATEQTWRDSKLLHLVFGISSLLMLLTTVWMLAADHYREWKGYQRQFRDVETWSTEAQIAQANNDRYATEKTRLIEELEAARREVPPRELIDEFEAEVTRDYELRTEGGDRAAKPKFERLEAAYKNLTEGDYKDKPDLREKLLIELDMFVVNARFREATLSLSKKSTAAQFDVERSNIGIAVDNNAPKSELDQLQKQTDEVKSRLDALTQQVQDAITHRKNLEKFVIRFTADVSAARKRLAEHEATLIALNKALYERENNWGKELLEMPIIDAFGRPLKVDQIWLPKLTINNNFRDVARFDRCTTCHQGMDKTAPGSAIEAGYKPTQIVTTTLATPAEAPKLVAADGKELTDKEIEKLGAEEIYKRKLEAMYGLQLSKLGLLHDNDVTISVVRPESPAALARLQVGDVITYIGDVKILDRPMALGYLVDNVNLGKPLALTIRRGLPNPFISHPRLDLYVGSLSPHKMAEIGCTICHEGQGSATEFKYASHTPSDPMQAEEWKREHGWFNNHHWIFPMNPQRFAESSCLKCHHEVVELEKSERYPDPPAPKLIAGYNVIRQYGCFGCHEINGYDGPNRRVGPDMRAEPNYSAAAQALLATGALSSQQAAWANQIARQPEDDAVRRELLQSIKSAIFTDSAADKSANDAKAGSDDKAGGDEKPAEKVKPVPPAVRKLSGLLDDVESPGKLRKVGPGLRHVASKLDYDFLYSWIRKPKDFRPTTKMPQFFGLTEQLSGSSLEASEKFEPIEIRGVTEYLLGKSQPFKFAKLPTEEPSAERGKKLFETRGCLACHQHKDFPKAEMNQGPDLSLIGAKLKRPKRNAEEPEGWLYTWLRDPSNYHPRTLMPNLKLDPIRDADGTVTNPADDIAAFLLTGDAWSPTNIPARKLDAAEKEALEELALDHLKTVFPLKEAKLFLETGIPEDRAGELKGDEVELLGTTSDADKMAAKKLLYVGRRTISKYGCAGCHDIPGFEDSKPIGTGLADWGRKSADKLAFEQIGQYILSGHGAKGHELPLHDDVQGDAKDTHAADESHALGHHEIKYLDLDPTTGFFLKSLMGHERTGFIWQKLRAPRSYDFMKTENKGYNERLRMPLFNINEEQREAVIAFVLGLLAEPPAAQYIYQPTPRRKALIDGQRIVEKFNCGGCHTLQMDQWQLAYQQADFSDPSPISDYPQLEPHFTPQQIKASLATDVRGLRHATLTGMPIVSPDTGEPVAIDEDGAPIDPEDKTSRVFYPFMPWDSVLLNGQVRPAGVQNLLVPATAIEKRYPPEGGYLPRLIYSVVVADERKLNPNAKADEAWGWLPPPLVGEGRKVQSAWLHDFLLDPFPIRPAVVLRMPKFNMSSAEASALAAYFAAVDNSHYPYDFDQRQRGDYLAEQDKDHPNRLGDALKIVTDNNFCIKCHLLGDFTPSGSDRAKAPRLDQVYKRLRPDFLWPWIANPKRMLPYTGMPVNIAHDKPVSQELYKGTSEQQLSAVVDLLLNYDRYTDSQVPIKSLIKAPPADAADADKEQAGRPAKPAADAGAAKPGDAAKAATDQASR